MAIDERQRHRLHERLDEVLGAEEAATLMSHLPPVGWADVATRRDVDHAVTVLGHELRDEISGLRDELRDEISGLREELHGEVSGLRGEVAGVRTELHKELGAIRADMLANHRQLVLAIIASQFTAVSLAFVATSL